MYSEDQPEINRPYNEYKIQHNCIVTGLYKLTNEIPRTVFIASCMQSILVG